eukprot:gene23203-28080_t
MGKSTPLEQRSQEFTEQAKKIADWDKHIMNNRRVLLTLEGDLSRATAAQDAVEGQLDYLEVHQDEIDKALKVQAGPIKGAPGADGCSSEALAMLQGIELEAEQMLKDTPEWARHKGRDELYKIAEELSVELNNMGQQLRDIITKVNDTQAPGTEVSTKDPLTQVTQVLNNQLHTLTHIDDQAAAIASKLDSIEQQAGRDVQMQHH